MKCMICGSENPDGASSCVVCGAPLSQVNPQAAQPNQFNQQAEQPDQFSQQAVQPNQFNQQAVQPNQFNQQAVQPNQFNQQAVQPNQFNQQAVQPNQFGQPGMQNMGQPNQFGQPGMQNMGQPNQFGQPGMQNMGGYQQPYGMQQPKPKKPLSKGAKIGIISGLAVALLVGIFFIFIFPILTRAKLGGSYSYKGSYYTDYYVFDDGIYVYYDIEEGSTTKNYYGIGTYTFKDDKVILTDIDGSTEEFNFDKKENTISYYGTTFKSSDKKAKLDFDISKEYLEGLESKIITASQTALKDEDVWEEAMWWESYYIYGTDLKDPYTDFEEALAKSIGYSSDSTLQYLLENDILSFDVDISSSGNVTVEFY